MFIKIIAEVNGERIECGQTLTADPGNIDLEIAEALRLATVWKTTRNMLRGSTPTETA